MNIKADQSLMAVGGGSFGWLFSSEAGHISRLMELIPAQDTLDIIDAPAQEDPSEPRSSPSAIPH